MTATVLDASGVPVANKSVTFALGGIGASIAVMTPSNGTALTNSQGVARISIAPTGSTSGAATITASATVGSASVSGGFDFSVAGAGGVISSSSPTLSLALFNGANTTVTNISSGAGNYVKATVLDATGNPVANKVVTFTMGGSAIAAFSPTVGTALTNTSGVAQIGISPIALSTAGAATVSAQASVGGVTTSASLDFSATAVNVVVGALSLGVDPIASAGNTNVQTTVTIGVGGAAAPGVSVAFTADCGVIQPLVATNGSGVAVSTYSSVKADGSLCSGTVNITASSGSSQVAKSLTVTPPVANAISFVSASPSQIYIKGSGAAEQSLVKFRVYASGFLQQNVGVTFTLANNPGGVGLGSSGSLTPVTATSDQNGEVSINVFSGTIPGPVQVKAALTANSTVFSQTNDMTVASGPPAQNHFDLSTTTFNIEGDDLSGTSTTLTIRVADRQGNPVADKTVINFTAEGGQVQSSCATATVNGISLCTAVFISQTPRPANGRVSVLAFTPGVKAYFDNNLNNAYDAGDTLLDLGDAFRDDDEDNTYIALNDGFIVPLNAATNVACTGALDPSAPSKAGTCTGSNILSATVRRQIVLLFSSSSAIFEDVGQPTNTARTFKLGSSRGDPTDLITPANRGNAWLPMPAGTALTTQFTGPSTTCKVVVNPSSVANIRPGIDPNADLRTSHTASFTACDGNTVIFTATAPSGLQTLYSVNVPSTLSTTAGGAVTLTMGVGPATNSYIISGGTPSFNVSSSNSSVLTASNSATNSILVLTKQAAGTAIVTVTDVAGQTNKITVTVN
jgi:hypothetical protein